MSEWQKVKIGDVIKRIKRPIVLENEKEYMLVTVKLYHKGVVLRECKKGCNIGSKMYEVKAGDFILSGIDARNGAFGIIGDELDGAIVTNDFWYFKLNEKLIDKHFFLELTSTKWFDEICRLGSDGTTQRIRLQKDRFFNQDIYLPVIEKQKELSKRFISIKEKKQKLDVKNCDQNNYLINLRQQILQDAISGKLTVDWRTKNPDIEPAIKLLEEIKAEKEKPVAEKKNKKEKPLPKITYDEIPFELPDKWEWVRLDKLGDFFTGNSINETIKKTRYSKINTGYPYIGTKDVYFNGSGVNYDSGVKIPFDEKGFRLAKTNTILFCIEGGSSGKKYAITNQVICFGNKLLASVITELINVFYVYSFYQSRCFLDQYKIKSKGLRGGVSVNKFKEILIPLPPLAEQKAIVAKVEKLMEHVSALEEKIKQNKQDAEMLMQSFLVEAFKN